MTEKPIPGSRYILPEFNIFRDGPDEYRLIAVDGTCLELDANGARLFFLLDRCPAGSLNDRLRERALPAADGELLEELLDAGFIQIAEAEPDPPYCLEQALCNVTEIDRGPLTLQELAITLSDACPLACTYCFRKSGGVRGKLDRDTIRKVLVDFRKLAGVTLNISGGEPASFSADVEFCASTARELGILHISVNSSGNGLSREMIGAWQAAGVNCLNLSLDCPDPVINDRLLGRPGATEQTLEAMIQARELGLPVHLNATLFAETVDRLPLFRPLLAGDGIRLRVNPYVPLGGNPPLSPRLVRQAVETVDGMIAGGLPVYIPVDPEEEYNEGFLCAGGLTRATVENDGRLGGCQFLMHRHGPQGTVQRDGLITLWGTGDFSVFRDEVVKPRVCCESCRWRPWCVAQCLAIHEGLPGDGSHCPFPELENSDEDH